MRLIQVIHTFALFLGIVFVNQGEQALSAQATTSPNIIEQISAKFSGGQPVQQVEISGNASWHVGNLEDTGTVNMAASANGSSQMQLLLSSSGAKTESQTGTGSNTECSWAGTDGTFHATSADSCLKPLLWFLPAFSLQSSFMPNSLRVSDLGFDNPDGTGSYRHLQSNLSLSGLPKSLGTKIRSDSNTDLWLDPSSFLPVGLSYSVHPDNGSATQVAIDIRYSNYREVSGVKIPFRIQRYVNGTLQLDIEVNAVQVD